MKYSWKLGEIAGIGVFVHWSFLILPTWVALTTFAAGGGVTSVLLLVTRIRGRKDHIPFGPYMVAGSYLALVAGAEIVDWYLG